LLWALLERKARRVHRVILIENCWGNQVPKVIEVYQAPEEKRGNLGTRGNLEILERMEPKDHLGSKGKRVHLGLAYQDLQGRLGLQV
ncbi:UNVERIFIED_CONTAM: hypothetical protein K2H54_050630, partial [Gekko kuhli]